MLIYADRFASTLAHKSLPWMTLIYGDELLLNMESLDVLRDKAKESGFTRRERFVLNAQTDFDALWRLSDMSSLFGGKCLLELHCDEPRLHTQAVSFLRKLAEKESAFMRVVLFAYQLDAAVKQSWYKSIFNRENWVVRSYSLSSHRFSKEVERRLHLAKLNLTQKAFERLTDACRGNLLAVNQLVEKLSLSSDKQAIIDGKRIDDELADSAQFDFTQLCDALLLQKWLFVLRISYKMEKEGIDKIPLLIWMIHRDMNVLYRMKQSEASIWSDIFKQMYVYRQREDVFRSASRSYSLQDIEAILLLCAQLDAICKGAVVGDFWLSLRDFVLRAYCSKEGKLDVVVH